MLKEALSTKNLEKIRVAVLNAAKRHSMGIENSENMNKFLNFFHEKTYEGHQKNPLYDLFNKATGQQIMQTQRGFPLQIIEPEIHSFEKLQRQFSPLGFQSANKRLTENQLGDITDKIEMSGRHQGFRDKIKLVRNVDKKAISTGTGINPFYVYKGYTFGEGGAGRRIKPTKFDYNYVTGTPEVALHYLKGIPEALDMKYSDPSTLGHYINTYNLIDFKNKVQKGIISPFTKALGKPTHLMRDIEIAKQDVLGPDLKTEPINHISNYEKTVNTMELDKRLHSKLKRLSSGQGWQQVAGKTRTPIDINFGYSYHPDTSTGSFSYDISKDKSNANSPVNLINRQYLDIL